MKGEVIYLYAFDVAHEIHTEKIEKILNEKPVQYQIRMDRALPKDIPLYRPLAIQVKPPASTLRGLEVKAYVRVYSVGVVSVVMRAGFDDLELQGMFTFHNPVLDDGRALDAHAQGVCAEVIASISPFMVRGKAKPDVPEAYTVFSVTELGETSNVNDWLAPQRWNIAGLLTETDPARLSEQQVAEVMRHHHSFENTDLAVIDWDAALVVDLTGYTDDVVYVLELANLQLEELQIMDELLDQYLDRAYDDVEEKKFQIFVMPSIILRALRQFRVDVTKLADELSNITKFFGDWYLARIYMSASERFHLQTWQESVNHRLASLDQLYTVVKTEINERRMLLLEVLIVILFVIDLIAIIFFKKG